MRSELPDELLAMRAAAGRLEDFEELLRRYRSRIYRICYRMAGNAEDAEDWSQECFVRAFRQLGSYRPERPFAPWFLRVVSNTTINLARSRSRRQGRVSLGLSEETPGLPGAPDPAQAVLGADGARRMRSAFDALAPALRQAIVLRVVEDLSLKELAATLGVPLQTAASRVRRGLMQVRERLQQSEGQVKK